MINLKEEKGSISVVVIVTILFIIVILSTTYTINAIARQGQLKSEISTKEQRESDFNNLDNIYKEMYTRNGLKIGDYVDYTPDVATAYSKDKLAKSISGSSNNTVDITQDTLKWQILRKYDDGRIDLIGTATTEPVYLSGALGYNNGVYLLNDICKSLYSKNSEGIIARSVNLEDFEYWLEKSEYGVKRRDNYYLYGTLKSYLGIYSYKPDIVGKTDNESDSYYTSPTTNTYTGGGSSDSLDVKETYYAIEIIDITYAEAYKVLKSTDRAWMSSRFVYFSPALAELRNTIF